MFGAERLLLNVTDFFPPFADAKATDAKTEA